MEMFMYDALGYINRSLEFEHNQLFNYILWTSSSEDIFLRTQSITRQKPLEDKKVNCKWLMMALQEPIEKASFNFGLDKIPPTKLQVYFL